MGMDVYGRHPTAPGGEYFRASIDEWPLLAKVRPGFVSIGIAMTATGSLARKRSHLPKHSNINFKPGMSHSHSATPP